MKLAVATPSPEVGMPVPVALLCGDFARRLQKAADLGYDGLELMVARPAELDAGAIRTQMSQVGLEIAAIASGAVYMLDKLTLLAADADVMQRAEGRLRELTEFAAQVGAPLVTIGGFRGRSARAGASLLGPRAPEQAASGSGGNGGIAPRDQLVGILRRAAGHASTHGVRLALEPLNRYESDVVNNSGEALALVDEVGHSNLGLLLDTFHVNIEETSPTACFRQAMAAGRLWHVHLGDSNRLAPGQGHIDFASTVTTLREVGYEGYLSAELLPRPDPDVAAEMTIRHMRQFVPKVTKSSIQLSGRHEQTHADPR